MYAFLARLSYKQKHVSIMIIIITIKIIMRPWDIVNHMRFNDGE